MATLIRNLSEDGGIIVSALDSTDIIQTMEKLHHPSAVCTAALGRLLTGACLMSANFKNTADTLTLRIKGDGPAKGLLARANGAGCVKGYIEEPLADMPPRADKKLDVGGVVGHTGTLSVIKDMGLKEPYIGQIPLTSGEIAEDITAYYAYSEQIPTVCALGVLVDKDLSVLRAGGYLLQVMPGATETELAQLEENIANMQSVTALLQNGANAQDIADFALKGFQAQVLDTTSYRYQCDCDEDYMRRALLSLGRNELEALRDEEDALEICCQFCNKKYHLHASDILAQTDIEKEK